jgi:hypothetical protein
VFVTSSCVEVAVILPKLIFVGSGSVSGFSLVGLEHAVNPDKAVPSISIAHATKTFLFIFFILILLMNPAPGALAAALESPAHRVVFETNSLSFEAQSTEFTVSGFTGESF